MAGPNILNPPAPNPLSSTPAWLANPLPDAPGAQPYRSTGQKLLDYALHDSLPARAVQSAWSGLTAPGDAWTGKIAPEDMNRRAGDMAALVTGGAGVVPAEANSLQMGIKAYHATPNLFDRFEPNWRGATFFAPTAEGARSGAAAGANDLLQHVSGSTQPKGPINLLHVDIPEEGIAGLHLTPSETQWFNSLPQRVVGDPALEQALEKMPNSFRYWDDLYDYNKLPSGDYEYLRKAQPPSLTYEQAASSGRDVYGTQHAHYSDQSDEAAIAQRIRDQGMKGYLVQDEGGLSIAMTDPSAVNILNRQGR